MMNSWIEKYSPKDINSITGQKSSVSKLLQVLESGRGVILHGPPGSGKTSSVKAIAREFNYELIEFDSEKVRNKENTETILGNAANSGSLFGRKRIILIDDFESFSRSDRGGLPAIAKIIKTSKVPIIIIALDLWDSKLKTLRSCCEKVEFKRIPSALITERLNHILSLEKIKCSSETLGVISENSNGDLRAAVNDLQMACMGKNEIKKEDSVLMERRISEKNIFNALQIIFQTGSLGESLESLENLGLDLSMISLWMSENVPRAFSSSRETSMAYDSISRSNVFYGRIMRRQHWGFYRYSLMALAGISTIENKKTGFVRYVPPSRFSVLFRIKTKRETIKSVSEKMSKKLHASSSKIRRDYTVLFKILAKKDKSVLEEAGIAKEEISVMAK